MIRACPDVEDYLKIAEILKYKVFSSGLFNLNIVGWRNVRATENRFEDWISVYRKSYSDKWTQDSWAVTTRPGIPYLLKPLSSKGAAILFPGQYLDSYKLGQHKGHKALVQTRLVKVYRDADLDATWDYGHATVETGLFGLNIHRAGLMSKLVGLWSAGCQVFANGVDFEEFISLCVQSAEIWGNSFSYTLIEF